MRLEGGRKEARPAAVLLCEARQCPVASISGCGAGSCRPEVKEPPHVVTTPKGLLVVSVPQRVASTSVGWGLLVRRPPRCAGHTCSPSGLWLVSPKQQGRYGVPRLACFAGKLHLR